MPTANNLICFLDCDGVISDFIGGCLKLVGKTYKDQFEFMRKPFSWSLSELFAPLDESELLSKMDVDFWENLEPYPWAKDLVEYLGKRFKDDLVLCTSAGYLGGDHNYFAKAVAGKEKWILKHFPQFATRTIICFRKEYLASPYHLLIDDSEPTVRKFVNNNGIGVLFPQDWNSLYSHLADPLSYIKNMMETF